VSARQSWHRLTGILAAFPPEQEVLALRKPEQSLSVEELSVAPPGEPRLVVRNVSFELQAGSALGIIGPTAAGKSTLARALSGIFFALLRLVGDSRDCIDSMVIHRRYQANKV
jgi:ATP-binding cassette subfamily C protein